MKKLCLTLALLLAASVLAPAHAGAPAAPEASLGEAAPAPADAPAVEACPAPVEQAINFTPNYCGDYCETPGTQTGCIDQSSSPWRRTICYCTSQHYLVC